MKNNTIRKMLAGLAKAPAIAGAEVIKNLPPEDRAEGERLLAALGLAPATETKKTEGGNENEKTV